MDSHTAGILSNEGAREAQTDQARGVEEMAGPGQGRGEAEVEAEVKAEEGAPRPTVAEFNQSCRGAGLLQAALSGNTEEAEQRPRANLGPHLPRETPLPQHSELRAMFGPKSLTFGVLRDMFPWTGVTTFPNGDKLGLQVIMDAADDWEHVNEFCDNVRSGRFTQAFPKYKRFALGVWKGVTPELETLCEEAGVELTTITTEMIDAEVRDRGGCSMPSELAASPTFEEEPGTLTMPEARDLPMARRILAAGERPREDAPICRILIFLHTSRELFDQGRADWLELALPLLDAKVSECAACGAWAPDMKVCQGCRVARYCSKECQLGAWEEHKKACKEAAAEMAAAAAGRQSNKGKKKGKKKGEGKD